MHTPTLIAMVGALVLIAAALPHRRIRRDVAVFPPPPRPGGLPHDGLGRPQEEDDDDVSVEAVRGKRKQLYYPSYYFPRCLSIYLHLSYAPKLINKSLIAININLPTAAYYQPTSYYNPSYANYVYYPYGKKR